MLASMKALMEGVGPILFAKLLPAFERTALPGGPWLVGALFTSLALFQALWLETLSLDDDAQGAEQSSSLLRRTRASGSTTTRTSVPSPPSSGGGGDGDADRAANAGGSNTDGLVVIRLL